MSEITKEQLELLMKSHKESVELNTTLIGKLDRVLESQKNSCDSMNKLCDKIDHQTDTLTTSNVQLGQTLMDMRTNMLQEHNSIFNRLYVAFGMMGSILVTLVANFVKSFFV